jgi:AcrR family transcriptional regulator
VIEDEKPAGLRADARRNRQVLGEAAREVFVEQGADARLEEIARRAGVGIATLYRHFPDRDALIRQVIMDNTRAHLAEATAAATEEDRAWPALVRYLTRVVELRLGLLKPVLGGRLQPDQEFRDIQRPLLDLVTGLVETAKQDGDLRADVEFGDIQLMVTLITRPLPTATRDFGDHLARRCLRLALAGLRATDDDPLPSPPVTAADADRLCFPSHGA